MDISSPAAAEDALISEMQENIRYLQDDVRNLQKEHNNLLNYVKRYTTKNTDISSTIPGYATVDNAYRKLFYNKFKPDNNKPSFVQATKRMGGFKRRRRSTKKNVRL